METFAISGDRLDAAIASMPHAHLKFLYTAVRLGGCALGIVPQGKEEFSHGPDRPAIYLIGDDMDTSMGPNGFHRASLRRAIRACKGFAVISCEALPTPYAALSFQAALFRQNVMIVETRLAHEADWYNLIQKLAPGRPILLATVQEGGRA